MAEFEQLRQAAMEANQTFLNVDAQLDEAQKVVEGLRVKWGEANAVREKAERAVLDHIRSSVNGTS